MKKNSTYVHKPGEKYIVIQKSELDVYLSNGYLPGTGISKEEYIRRNKASRKTIEKRYGVSSAVEIPHVKDVCQSDEAKKKRITSRRET